MAGGAIAMFADEKSTPGAGRDVVTQVSTYDALARGLYTGAATLETLVPHGDFGVGTLHGWNGEIVLLDGRYHLIDGAGKVTVVTDLSATTPFLQVTWFDADHTKRLSDGTTFTTLKTSPTQYLDNVNVLHAVKIKGTFRRLRARSMPTQALPYKPMRELVKTQPEFEFTDVEGTLVGFWTPASLQGVGLAGWHLHFLADDHSGGGHVLSFETADATLVADPSPEFRWQIPATEEYRNTDFGTAAP